MNRCEVALMRRGEWHSRPCGKPAKVQVDGRWYCGIHDPVKQAERDAEATRKWEVRNAAFRLRDAAPDMRDALMFILEHSGDPVMENVARAALAKAGGKQ